MDTGLLSFAFYRLLDLVLLFATSHLPYSIILSDKTIMPRLTPISAIAIAMAGLLLATSSYADDDIGNALTNSRFNLDLRAFYFDRKFSDATPGRTAFTAGGIAKLETGSFKKLQFGAAHYGNYSIGIVDKARAAGTSLLENGTNDNLSFLGEAYAKYSFGLSSLQLGRQRLSTPLANDHDLRALPVSYEAAVFRTKEIRLTLLETGWIKRYSGFGSRLNSFPDSSATWGKDGLAYVYLENSPTDNLRLRGQFAKAQDVNGIAVRDYRYVDAKVTLPKDIFFEGQYGGNDYAVGTNSKLFGLAGGIKFQKVDFAMLYNKIGGNSFRAIEAGPVYADWQQGYANYEPSLAFGGYLVFRPQEDLSVKLGRVNVAAKEASKKDDFKETILDAHWKINSANALRLRYSLKDQSAASGTADTTDLRIIYYYSFSM